MKIAIIGGGPAGLYAAILLKKQRPNADIAVYERNCADDTFGFGVVFSDATLDNFETYDPPSYRRITREFAYWDDIAVHFRGTVHRVGGNGFCGCARRTLLMILQDRARELGVLLHFEIDVEDETRFADADLVIVADGINSRFREKYVDHFAPEVDLRSNKFAWMGSTRPLDAFTFIFQETEWGPFIAHAYQYEAGHSTWIFETDPATFERAGLTGLDERQSAERMKQVFGWFLGDHPLLTNRSMWRNFPMIRNKRWVKGNMVLLGDAKASAHFSIGSGTKLAMEDAIALADAMQHAPSVAAALDHYEHGRREEVEKTQHAADVSLVWFEHVDRFWQFDPVQFAFRDRLGRGRHHRRRRGFDRARFCQGRSRSCRRLDRADRARGAADLWSHVPDALLRPGPQRGTRRHHVRRQHHHRRPGQHHSRRRPCRSGRARPPASGRPDLHHEGRRLVWRGGVLPAAISAGQRADLSQQRARPAGFRGPQN
jgi:anthraniloyl-CoA monooxygenase